MKIWAIDQAIDELEIELRSIQDSKASVRESVKHAWSDNLDADAVAALLAKARDCKQRERQLERRLERLYGKRTMTTGHRSPDSTPASDIAA